MIFVAALLLAHAAPTPPAPPNPAMRRLVVSGSEAAGGAIGATAGEIVGAVAAIVAANAIATSPNSVPVRTASMAAAFSLSTVALGMAGALIAALIVDDNAASAAVAGAEGAAVGALVTVIPFLLGVFAEPLLVYAVVLGFPLFVGAGSVTAGVVTGLSRASMPLESE